MERHQKGLALNSSKGFTLIEVVLVLAIGGLIFLLAFLAFQQVSRNRRDTQRRSDASRILAELQNWVGDKGSFPAASAGITDLCGGTPAAGSFQEFFQGYVCPIKTPNNANYGSVSGTTSGFMNTGTAVNRFRLSLNRSCAAADTAVSGSIRLELKLESGILCLNSQ